MLGKIVDVDEIYINGVRIGGTGSFPPNFQSARDQERCYRVPAGVVHGDGTDLIAVRVFGAAGKGGIYAAGATVRAPAPSSPTRAKAAPPPATSWAAPAGDPPPFPLVPRRRRQDRVGPL